MKKRDFLYIIFSIVLVFGLIFNYFSDKYQEVPEGEYNYTDGILEVHFQDVENADSVFLRLPDGKCALIDGAERESADKIISYIESFGVNKIDYVVATHPHSDHIGGLPKIIDRFEIGQVFMPDVVHTTSDFENLIESVENKNIPVTQAKQGVLLFKGENYVSEFLSPISNEYENLNDYSAVIKLTYLDKSFLFMGDAEKYVEYELIEEYGTSLEADVLKVGHHGSNSSSSSAFLKKVKPEKCVISAGAGNDYGHPHKEVMERLEEMNTEILRTDKQGTVVLKTDGYEWSE